MVLQIGEKRFGAEETDGVWANIAALDTGGYVVWTDDELPPVEDDGPHARVKVARYGNPEHRQEMERLARRYRKQMDADGMLPPALQRKMDIEATAIGLLKSWENCSLSENGKPTPYSVEEGIAALKADDEFRTEILLFSRRNAVYLERELEEDAESLGNSSSGGRRGASSSKSSKAQE